MRNELALDSAKTLVAVVDDLALRFNRVSALPRDWLFYSRPNPRASLDGVAAALQASRARLGEGLLLLLCAGLLLLLSLLRRGAVLPAALAARGNRADGSGVTD